MRESREKAGLEMLTVDTVAKVRRAHFVDGKKIKRIVIADKSRKLLGVVSRRDILAAKMK